MAGAPVACAAAPPSSSVRCSSLRAKASKACRSARSPPTWASTRAASTHSSASKEELQLATLAAARTILIDCVIAPALESEEGLPRLRAIGEAWCDYLAADVFAGGCFLCAASAEMDGRPGSVRDAVESVMRAWIAVLASNLQAAMTAGDLRADVRPSEAAFRLNALGMAANWQRQLMGDETGIDYARSAWREELDRLSSCRPGANQARRPRSGQS